MAKKRITVTIDSEIADYLSGVPNTSAVVCEAVNAYRTRQLERDLETAYREDSAQNAELAAEWAPADAEVEE